jgi:hypothetical protein
MRMRDEIFYNTYGYGKNPLNEMAAAELAKVVGLIKSGNLKDAAAKYVEVGGNPSSSGVGKTVNSYIAKNPDLSPEEKQYFEQFKSAVEETRKEKDIKTTRPETYKTGTTGVTRKGEEIVVKGLSQEARKNNVLKVIDKQKKEIDAERAMLDDPKTDVADLQSMAKEFVNDMQHAEHTAEDKMFMDTLTKFSKTGEEKDKAIDIMHTIVDEGEKVLTALKRRVAAGNMVKPSDQKLLGQAERYKKIDAAKAQKSLDADKQKQLEQKNEESLNEEDLSTLSAIIIALSPVIGSLLGYAGANFFMKKTEIGKRFMNKMLGKDMQKVYGGVVENFAIKIAKKMKKNPERLIIVAKKDMTIKFLTKEFAKTKKADILGQITDILAEKAKEIYK